MEENNFVKYHISTCVSMCTLVLVLGAFLSLM